MSARSRQPTDDGAATASRSRVPPLAPGLAAALDRIGLGWLGSGSEPWLVVEESPLTPLAAARRLAGRSRLALLDSSLPGGRMSRYSYLAVDPFLVVRSRGRRVELRSAAGAVEIEANPYAVVAALLASMRLEARSDLPPFVGGAIGYLGYDLGRLIERLPARLVADPDLPELDLAFHDRVLAFDHVADRGWLIGVEFERSEAGSAVSRLAALRAELAGLASAAATVAPAPRMALRSNFTRVEYLAAVRRVLEDIAAGEVYQVNLSQRLEGRWGGSAWDAYERLRATSPVPYGAFLELDGVAILSASPERFLRLDGWRVETRPMKGTRPRGANSAADRALGTELARSEKDRAENVMIVDLLRNDLGRVCRTGSIRVEELYAVEPYATVWQMVSTVSGEMRVELGAVDLLRACHPGGSITGCPKIRAMELIEELEPVRRGVYCGAIGYLSFNGAMDTSIAISTVVLSGERLLLGVGGGIVADSDPEAEYAETILKARATLTALAGEVTE